MFFYTLVQKNRISNQKKEKIDGRRPICIKLKTSIGVTPHKINIHAGEADNRKLTEMLSVFFQLIERLRLQEEKLKP